MNGRRIALFASLDGSLYSSRLLLMERLIERGATVFAIAPPGRNADRFEEHGIRFVPFLLDRTTLNPYRVWVQVRSLGRLMRRLDLDLVHSFSLRPNACAGLAAPWAGVPFALATVTGLGSLYAEGASANDRIRRAGVSTAMRLAFRNTSAVVFQNPDDRELFTRQGICSGAQAELIISSGVDTEHFSRSAVDGVAVKRLRQTWGIAPEDVVVLMTSRFIRQKGILEFQQAARELAGRARFVLLGAPDPGNPHAMSEEDLRQDSDAGIVLVPGFQTNVPEWLAMADVFAYPSYYREGVPRSVLEAMSMQLPIVTTDSPGCRETVIHEETGLLIPTRDTGALVEAISRLIDDPKARGRFGDRSRELAKSRFMLQEITSRYMALYERILDKR